MSILGEAFLFFIGLAVGSFLNVLIDRLPKEENVLVGRSYCDHCRHPLAWYDLIPLLSFVLLRGRCRYCQKKISWQYPMVELLTGGMFVLGSLGFLGSLGGSLISLCYLFFVLCCLIVIFFADLKYGIIPDKVVYPAIAVTFLFRLQGVRLANSFTPGSASWRTGVFPWLASGHLGGGTSPIINYLLAGLGALGFFGALVLLTKGKGMGLGDVKLAFLMGLALGFPEIIVALYFAFLTGALLSAILILTKRKKFGQTIPFGPFLSAGTIFSLFYGEKAVSWWLKIMM